MPERPEGFDLQVDRCLEMQKREPCIVPPSGATGLAVRFIAST
jgi:hypothetical protein